MPRGKNDPSPGAQAYSCCMSQSEDLISSTAITTAVALAEYSSLYDLLSESSELSERDQLDLFHRLSEIVRKQALTLLLLSRSICEYGDTLRVSKEDDPRMALPILQEIGASYALLALAKESSEFQIDLLLSPERLDTLLHDRLVDFISRWGEQEAIAILKRQQEEG